MEILLLPHNDDIYTVEEDDFEIENVPFDDDQSEDLASDDNGSDCSQSVDSFAEELESQYELFELYSTPVDCGETKTTGLFSAVEKSEPLNAPLPRLSETESSSTTEIKKKTLNCSAPAFVFPSVSAFSNISQEKQDLSLVNQDDQKSLPDDMCYTYPPSFLMQFSFMQTGSGYENYEYGAEGMGMEEDVPWFYYQNLDFEQALESLGPKEEKEDTRIKFDAPFILSLRAQNTMRPEDFPSAEDCEAVLSLEELERMRHKMMASTSSADASLLGENAGKTKLSKSAKKKKKLAAAAAAAAVAVGHSVASTMESHAESPFLSRSSSVPHGNRPSPLDISSAPSRISTQQSPALARSSSEPPLSLGTPGRWRPSQVQTEEGIATKSVRSVLNKLTPEKFDKLLSQILDVKISQQVTLDCVVDVIVQKAAGEAAFSGMYSDLVARMAKEMVLSEGLNFVESVEKRSLGWFLSHRRVDVMPSKETIEATPEDEREQLVTSVKNGWMGMVTLISELYKREILGASAVDEVWKKVQEEVKNENAEDEDAETLCTFLSAAGETLEVRRDDLSGDFYACLKGLSSNDKFSTRIKFKAQELLELRKAKWVPRRAAVVNPKKLSAQHASIVQHSLATTPMRGSASTPMRGKNNHYSSPASHRTPSTAGPSPATPASGEKWDRTAWEEQMVRDRKNRLKNSPGPGAWSTPQKNSLGAGAWATPLKTPVATPTLSYAGKVKGTPSTPGAGEKWNRVAWEEEMARERQLRIERERKAAKAAEGAALSSSTHKASPTVTKHASGKQPVQILKRIQQPGPK